MRRAAWSLLGLPTPVTSCSKAPQARRSLRSTAAAASGEDGGASSGASSGGGSNAGPGHALQPGAVFATARTFTAEEVAAFAALTGDSNAIHTSSEAAERRGLPGPVLPGMLMASLFPAIIGSNFPGALYLSQTLKFKRHALVGDSLAARLTVERASGSRVSFQTLCCSGSNGEVLLEGTALALMPQAERG